MEFMYSYLEKRVQRVKLNSDFSDWLETKQGVPQESILSLIYTRRIFSREANFYANFYANSLRKLQKNISTVRRVLL